MDWKNLPDEKSYRFVAVLNKKIEIGKLMNALGHMTAGLTGKVGANQDMCFLEYKDKDGGVHPGISHFPFIVLSADNSNKIRTVRNEAIKIGLPFTDFTSTMTIGTSQQQVEATEKMTEIDLEYYGIVLFGRTEILRGLTNKFSIFK
jgi:hypothetical protein